MTARIRRGWGRDAVARILPAVTLFSGWALLAADPDRTNVLAVTYLNRLSDLLFLLARVADPDGDVKWVPGASR